MPKEIQPHSIKPSQIIDPRCWYRKTEVLRMGYGRPFLEEGRRKGVINGRIAGKSVWFQGSELLDWLMQQPVASLNGDNRQLRRDSKEFQKGAAG